MEARQNSPIKDFVRKERVSPGEILVATQKLEEESPSALSAQPEPLGERQALRTVVTHRTQSLAC